MKKKHPRKADLHIDAGKKALQRYFLDMIIHNFPILNNKKSRGGNKKC